MTRLCFGSRLQPIRPLISGPEVNKTCFFSSNSAHIPRAPRCPEHSPSPNTLGSPAESGLICCCDRTPVKSIVFPEVLNFHQGGEDDGGEGYMEQMYSIVSSILYLLPLHFVCVFHQKHYESVIRVVTHLSNAPIPLGCHTL